MKELGKMPRPGPRPYECVRKAWHSDRHHPIRGSLIQEIFRVVEKVHSSATRKNKEWQEKLPIVVIKAEEIMYSKANSEAEYMDLKTLWDRATNAINTIIRRDESTETGKFLQPCIEAALNLGCTARRASRSQRNCNPKCYLTPSIQETLHTSSGTVENAFQGNHTTNLQYLSRCSKLVNPASLIPTGPSNFIQNIDYASNKYPFASESILPSCNIPSLPMKNYTVTNFCSVYPLCYVNDCPFEESQDGFGILPKVDSSTSDPAQVGIENLCSCNVDALYQMTETNSSGTPEKLCKIGCDLSLRLGPVSDTCPSVGNSKVQLQDVDSGNFPNGRKFCYQSLEVDKKLSLIPVKAKSKKVRKEKKDEFNWDSLRKQVEANGKKRERTANTMDSVDWEALRSAGVHEIADAIKERGMNNVLAGRIQDFLNRLVREHGSIDLEWLRDVPPDQVKEYLLSIRGLGLKSVECVRLLTLHHLAFPVDTNVGRIAVRLGWVPLQPLPESLQLHLLELYPVLESIQKYLWPRLCKLDQRTLYELHYQMITFGKVFCTKSKPNCNSCPMRGECRHFASAFASARLALPGPEEKSIVTAAVYRPAENPDVIIDQLALPLPQATNQSEGKSGVTNCEPIIEEPATPEPECTQAENDIEDSFYEDPNGIPTIKLNIEEFTQNLQNYMQNSMELQEINMSNALVALTPEAASIPMPKLKNVSRLRTEHQVYELPD